ncbi:MAG: hypothetical protein ACOX2M_07710 [Fastidiosipilaceae bacterium]
MSESMGFSLSAFEMDSFICAVRGAPAYGTIFLVIGQIVKPRGVSWTMYNE